MATAGTQTLPARPRRNLVGVVLALLVLAAAVILVSSDPGLLVALNSSRDGQALLPTATLAPGQATSGDLVLANEGFLPITYTLNVQGGDDAQPVIMRVRKAGSATYLYQGVPPRRPVTLGRLLPGDHVQLDVIVIAPVTDSTTSVPIDYTFVWTGRSPGFSAWWWIVPIAVALVLAAFGLPRLLAFLAWVRTRRPQQAERYWRTPIILAALLLAALLPLTGVSLSSVNAQTENPANVFAVGTLALSDQSPTGKACMSITADQAGPVQSRCDAIFDFTGMAPGRSGTGRIGIRNVGTIPIGKLGLWTDGCTTSDAPGEGFHGTGELCGEVRLQVHDDSHDACYYPVSQPGPCPADASGTLAGFAAAHPAATPLTLTTNGLGQGVTFSFNVSLDPAAGNSVQGRTTQTSFTWQATS